MDCQRNGGPPHFGKTGSLHTLTFSGGIAHDVTRTSLPMYSKHKLIHRILEIKKLQMWLQKQPRLRRKITEVRGDQRCNVCSVEGFDVGPLQARHIQEQLAAVGSELRMMF